MQTRQYHWDADKAGDAGANESQTAGPPSTQQLGVHHEDADDICRDLQGSRHKCVDVNIAMQSSSIQRKSIVD